MSINLWTKRIEQMDRDELIHEATRTIDADRLAIIEARMYE